MLNLNKLNNYHSDGPQWNDNPLYSQINDGSKIKNTNNASLALKTKSIAVEKGIYKPLIKMYNNFINRDGIKIIIKTEDGKTQLVTVKVKKLKQALNIDSNDKNINEKLEVLQKEGKLTTTFKNQSVEISTYKSEKQNLQEIINQNKNYNVSAKTVTKVFKKSMQRGLATDAMAIETDKQKFIIHSKIHSPVQVTVIGENMGADGQSPIYRSWNITEKHDSVFKKFESRDDLKK